VDPRITARTERLLIRPLRLEDAADVNIMRADPEVMKHTYELCYDSDVILTDALEGQCYLVTRSRKPSLGSRAATTGPITGTLP
jgi:hypothetical protein